MAGGCWIWLRFGGVGRIRLGVRRRLLQVVACGLGWRWFEVVASGRAMRAPFLGFFRNRTISRFLPEESFKGFPFVVFVCRMA